LLNNCFVVVLIDPTKESNLVWERFNFGRGELRGGRISKWRNIVENT